MRCIHALLPAILLLLGVTAASSSGPSALASELRAKPYAPAEGASQTLVTATQIAFLKGMEVISDLGHSRFLYRPEKRDGTGGPWLVSPVKVKGQHSLTLGGDGLIYADDTENNRLIAFPDLATTACQATLSIAGKTFSRPHDVVFEPRSGWLYAVCGNRRLYRFHAFGKDESFIQFTEREMGYARALSVVDGKLYVINSSRGEVIRIDDFAARKFTVFRSPGKREDAPAGAWEKTGLVLNDVDFYNGYWYGTNFFVDSYAPGCDTDRFRLIRWKSWPDFEAGRWEEISDLIPKGMIPYYLTAHRGKLFVAAFHKKDSRGMIYCIEPKK